LLETSLSLRKKQFHLTNDTRVLNGEEGRMLINASGE
jgi:hypothetical protein